MTTKTDKYQIGMSATASNNFVLLPDGAGALEIKRGNLGAEGETVATIDANGFVRGKVPAFSAVKTVDQSIPVQQYTTLAFQSVLFNIGDGWDGASSRYTAPVSGIYRIAMTCTTSASVTTELIATASVNGLETLWDSSGRLTPAGRLSAGIGGDVLLNAGDYVVFLAWMEGAGTIVANRTRAYVSYVGEAS